MDKKLKKNLKVLATRVFLMNMISRFKDINLKNTRIASIPNLGVFWVDVKAGKIYSDMTSLKEADVLGEFKIHPRAHYDVWRSIQNRNPKWKGMEYEDIPRGRIVYKQDPKDPKFIVLMCDKLNTPKIKKIVTNEFNLPLGYVEFDFTDEHYELPEDYEKVASL